MSYRVCDIIQLSVIFYIYVNMKLLIYELDGTQKILETINNFIIEPIFNLPHLGNICHFNSCMILLSILDKVIDITQQPLHNVFSAIYSPIQNFTNDIINSLNILNININIIDEATETMKKIYKFIMNNNYDIRHLVFYYDASNDFLKENEKKLTFDELIDYLKPLYLIINIFDFNIIQNIYNEQSNKLIIINNCKYLLIGIAISLDSHFVSAVIINGKVKIYNDISNRNDITTIEDISQLWKLRHVIGVYIRIQ